MEKILYKEMQSLEQNHFWFKARRNIIYTVLNKIILKNRVNKLKALEIGSGTGGNLNFFSQYFMSIKGIEMEEFAIQLTKESFGDKYIVTKGHLPYNLGTNEKFDVIFLLDVLEHVKQNKESLTEILKLLNEDGRLIITVPAFMFLWSKHDVYNHHQLRYTKSYLLKILDESGYKIDYSSYYNFFLFFPIFTARILSNILGFLNKTENVKSDLELSFFNSLLYKIFNFETYILKKGIKFPFGVSIIAVCSKK